MPPAGGEQAANTLQPDGSSRRATTLDAKVRGTNAALLQAARAPCLFSHGKGRTTLVRWWCAATPAPTGQTRATTSARISELRGFTAIAHYCPVGGVSEMG
jgi:hypothetical protein